MRACVREKHQVSRFQARNVRTIQIRQQRAPMHRVMGDRHEIETQQAGFVYRASLLVQRERNLAQRVRFGKTCRRTREPTAPEPAHGQRHSRGR